MPPTTTASPRKSKPGLRPTQVKILKVLVRASADSEQSALKMAQIVKRVRVSKVMCHFAMGAVDPKYRDAHDKKKNYLSLLSRGYVKVFQYEDEPFVRYFVSALGERAFEAISDK